MTREDFVIRWRTRLSEWARIGALDDGARANGAQAFTVRGANLLRHSVRQLTR